MINIEDLKKLDIRIGKVLAAEKVEGADKLLKLNVDFGLEQRQIISGIAQFYNPEDLVGKQFPFIINLEYRMIRGVESQGMILTVDADGEVVLLSPNKEVPVGSIIK